MTKRSIPVENGSSAKKAKRSSRVRKELLEELMLTSVMDKELWPASGEVYAAQRKDTLISVFQTLIEKSFLSVPVLQQTKQKWYGFLDITDIVKYIVDHFGDQNLESVDDYWKHLKENDRFKELVVNDVIKYPLTRRNPFHPVLDTYSLFHVVELLAKERSLHRVPIVSAQRNLRNIITQSQIIGFLHRRKELLGDFNNDKCIDIATKPVVSVNAGRTAMDAFSEMMSRNVSGVAIVDNDGKLVGNLSLRDIKGVTSDGKLFERLYRSVGGFVAELRKDFEAKHGRPPAPVVVAEDATILAALEAIHKAEVHRVFVVDAQEKPIGVVALKDILHAMF